MREEAREEREDEASAREWGGRPLALSLPSLPYLALRHAAPAGQLGRPVVEAAHGDGGEDERERESVYVRAQRDGRVPSSALVPALFSRAQGQANPRRWACALCECACKTPGDDGVCAVSCPRGAPRVNEKVSSLALALPTRGPSRTISSSRGPPPPPARRRAAFKLPQVRVRLCACACVRL